MVLRYETEAGAVTQDLVSYLEDSAYYSRCEEKPLEDISSRYERLFLASRSPAQGLPHM